MTDEALLGSARAARERAYAPYSDFRVGAALLTDDGAVFTAGNVENASYGLTVCAERVAVFRAVAEGRSGFAAIAIVTGGAEPVAPCGACRQVLAEFAPQIRVVSEAGGRVREWTLGDLQPEPFRGPLPREDMDSERTIVEGQEQG